MRFGLPVMLGELLAGVIIGPACFGIISVTQPLELLAELGIFFAMFYAGMEMDPKELVEHTEGFHGIAEFPFVWQTYEPYAPPLQV
ncbi:MAG: hypothetical protein AMK69_03930 [Nitrospira bacterium SG8_3]|nr:MAG: hypothetical protein AMK69_03930 [Nitrospira bacterium SG8_3]